MQFSVLPTTVHTDLSISFVDLRVTPIYSSNNRNYYLRIHIVNTPMLIQADTKMQLVY